MEIKAADVMKLRKMTGAGMMDCKKALIEAEGDFARAQDIIREKGKLIVAKRADRTATEGVVVTKIVGQKAYILCLACETDFVAQNSEYSASAEAMLEVAVKNDAADRDALMAAKKRRGPHRRGDGDREIGSDGREDRAGLLRPHRGSLLRRLRALQQEAGYDPGLQQGDSRRGRTHRDHAGYGHGSRFDLGGGLPAEVVEHERKIAVEAMKQDPKNANKPEAILEKIAEGKMRKFFEENTLLAQPVVGEKESIADYIHKADKDATVVAYKRFALGE